VNTTRVRRTRIILVWALLCCVVSGGTAAYLQKVWSHEMASAFSRADTAAELTEQALLRAADGLYSVLDMVRARTELAQRGQEGAAAVIDQRLADIVANQRFGVRGASLADGDGIIRWTVGGQPIGASVVHREVYGRIMVEGQAFFIAAPVESRTTGRWISLAGQRLDAGNGEVGGMALVALDPLHLGRLLSTMVGQSGRVLLVRHRSNGQVLAASHDATGTMSRVAMPDHPVVIAARDAAEGRLAYGSPINGRAVLTAWRRVGVDFIAQASFNRDTELLAPYRRIARPVLGAAALLLIGSLILALAWDRNMRLRARLEELAGLDPLTGLCNRRALEERMALMLQGPGRRGTRFACLLFDIDHFKRINDRFGHAAGDEVLCRIAALLRGEVRGSDIVCRWGGEEMLVILVGCSREQAMLRAEALRAAIGRLDMDGVGGTGPFQMGPVTASVGVACYPQDGSSVFTVVCAADAAMYRAKRAGRNQVAMGEGAMAA